MWARIRTTALPAALAVTGALVAATAGPALGAPSISTQSAGVVGASNSDDARFGSACDRSQPANEKEERLTAELMMDWASSATAAGFSDLAPGVTPSNGKTGDLALLNFVDSEVTVTVSRRQVTQTDAVSTDSRSLGSPSTGAVFSNTARLQDCAPRPADLTAAPTGMRLRSMVTSSGFHDPADRATFWNATTSIGADAGRDGALFEFSEPVGAFGAWFGDLESRDPKSSAPVKTKGGTSGSGTGVQAIVKLFNATGDLIETRLVDPDEPAADDAACGGSVLSKDLLGCGNQATRFIGFVDQSESVKKMLVIVGDDDSCRQSAACDATTEYLSWSGPLLAEVSPTPTPTSTTAPASTKAPTTAPPTTAAGAVAPSTTEAPADAGTTTTTARDAAPTTTTTDAPQVSAAAESSKPPTEVKNSTESRQNPFTALAFTGLHAATGNIVVTGVVMMLAGAGFVLLTGRRRRKSSSEA